MERQLIDYLGGDSNIVKTEEQNGQTYIVVKDSGLVNIEKIKEISMVKEAIIKRGKVIISYDTKMKKEISEMAKDYTELAKLIIENIGGKENITYLTHCITRLRFNVHNKKMVNLDALKGLKGTLGVQWSSDQLQIIIGAEVDAVYEAVYKLEGLGSLVESTESIGDFKEKKKWSINILFETLSACMIPVLPALCGTGVIKGILVLLTTYCSLPTDNSVYVILNTIADVAFYFMPFLVASAASNKFKVNNIVSLMMVGLFLHPTFTSMIGSNFNLLGIDIHILNYSSTVFPAIISVWMLSYVYKFIDRILPKVLRFVITPAIALIIMAPICLGLIGPIGYYIGYYLATFVSNLFHLSPMIGGLVLGIIRPFVLLTGMQTTFTPIILNNLSTYGYDFIWPVHSVFSMACCGLCIGAFLKARKLKNEMAEEKEVFLSSFVSGFAGVSEPSLYGIAFRFKSQLIALVLSSGISGAIVSALGAKVYAAGNPPWLFLAGFGETMGIMIVGFIISFILALVFSYIAGFTNNFKKDKK